VSSAMRKHQGECCGAEKVILPRFVHDGLVFRSAGNRPAQPRRADHMLNNVILMR
jgi:hypothetical protein